MKVIIIGGVAGGMSAATRLRRLMADAEIIVYEKGPYVSFANCGLPYHISGEIDNREDLLVQTPESLKARFNIDVNPFHEVLAIDAEKKEVTVQSKNGVYTEKYDKLILSPGAKPFIPQIDGLDEAKNVHTLRNVPDLDAIMQRISEDSQEAVVIGAGFIGLEVAENLQKRGLHVTIVERSDHILPPLDLEMAAFLHKELTEKGIKVITNQSAVAFSQEGKKVHLENGEVIDSDLTILSVGVQPNTEIAQKAGIETGLRQGIKVDDTYQTSQKDIYAVGDAIIVKQEITGEDALISLASPANRQGRQVADVIAGLKRKNKGSIGTAIVRVFDKVAASTGLNERQAKEKGLPYKVVHVGGKSHASYYPDAKDMTLKLVFDANSGKIYGAQAVGEDGVDKRIDIIATAIKGDLTVFDLPELELTYAPPFGSAKDPVNMLGYVASNLIEGTSQTIQWYEVKDKLAEGYRFLDVRNPSELANNGIITDGLNIPLNELSQRLAELDPKDNYIVSCHSGLRSYVAERLLKQNGYTVVNLDGAFALYRTVKPEEIKHV